MTYNPEYQARYRYEHREKIRAYQRQRYAINPRLYCQRGRSQRYLSLYGITVEQYDALLSAQDGHCALCGVTNNNGKRLAVHHDHTSGRVIALLCYNHNRSLSAFGDTATGLRANAVLLERAESQTRKIMERP